MASGESPAPRRAFSWAGARLLRRRAGQAAAAATVLLAGGCLDLGFMLDTAFPATVPGLRSDQPWLALPIGGWVVEGGISAQAIAACLDPACSPRAAIGLFTATGADAAILARLLDDPDALRRGLLARIAAAPRRSKRRAATAVEVAPRREGALTGFALRLAGADRSREAAAVVLARRRPDEIRLILIVAPTLEAADRVARDVAPHLG